MKYKYTRKEIIKSWNEGNYEWIDEVFNDLLAKKPTKVKKKCEHKNLKRAEGDSCENVGICQDCGTLHKMPTKVKKIEKIGPYPFWLVTDDGGVEKIDKTRVLVEKVDQIIDAVNKLNKQNAKNQPHDQNQ